MSLNTEVDYNNVVIKGTVELGVKGERGLQGFKGDQGIQGPPVPLAREPGDDPDLAVSQKLLTDSIADMEQGNEAAVLEATHQAGLAGDSAVIATDQAGIAASRADEAAQSAQAASGSAQTSGQQATTATEQAGIATIKANDASSSASNAASSAGLAADSKAAAEQAATTATTKADEASQSAQAAAQSATQAEETLDDKVDKADIAQATGTATDKVMSQKAVTELINSLMRWSFSVLFMGGESGVWYRPSIMSTLFQSSSGATPVVSIGDPVGLMLDKSGNDNHATQSASSFRPTYTLDPSGASVLLGDGVDDVMTTPPATYSGTSYISTSYGWYKSSVQEGVAARLPLTWLREYVTREGAASVADDNRMRNYFATEQKLMIWMTRNLVIKNLRVFSGGSATTVVAIGNNGATAEKQLSINTNQTWDLSADGLTAPALLVFDSNTALANLQCLSNQLAGSIPDLSSYTAITYFSCSNNNLTGSIPDLSVNTALVNFQCNDNQLTGWSGGSVSNTIGNFAARSNLLAQTAIDGLLVAFDATGRETGTLNLGGVTNSTPSATGKTAADNLRAKGWAVYLNGY